MLKENEGLQNFIEKGPSWTDAQNEEKNRLMQKIESERNYHSKTQDKLQSTRKNIDEIELEMDDIDRMREGVIVELASVESEIEVCNNRRLARQTQINEIQNLIESTSLQLQESNEELRTNNEIIIMEEDDSNNIIQRTKDAQLDIEKSSREHKEYESKTVATSSELDKQHQIILAIDNENEEKMKLIEEKSADAKLFSEESVTSERKKDIISAKIQDVERSRIRYEEEKDDLKLRLNKIGSVELKMMAQEMETHKRQLQSLQLEKEMLERKKKLTEKSSSLVTDIIASNTATLKNLDGELEAFRTIEIRQKDQIEELKLSLERERKGLETATKKRRDAIMELKEQEVHIDVIHKQVDDAESKRKQKQSLCDAMKADNNLQAKRLAENHEELDLAKRELDLIGRQMKALKIQVASIENNTVMEHFNHHHTDEEKDTLKTELENLRQQIEDVDQIIQENNNTLLELGTSIANKDRECDKYSKEYCILAGNRDILGSLLVQKSAELEKLQEKIRGQQSILHHGELQFSGLISSIHDSIMKLRGLLKKKQTYIDLERVNDDLMTEVHGLEKDLHLEELKTVALRDELSRPVNIHRWRSLEHRDPVKFQKIERIQRLQNQIIAITENITDKDALIREQEKTHLELTRISGHQPQLQDINEQLELYQTNLGEKLQQMKEIQVELEIQKRRVDDLKDDMQEMDNEWDHLQSSWVSSEFFSTDI